MAGLIVKIDAAAVEQAFRKAPREFTNEFRKAIKIGATEIQREARRNHPTFTSRSGNADRSVQTDYDQSGGKVYLDTGVAKYSPYLHEGTGIFGPKRRPITPKKKKFLHFFSQTHGWVRTKSVKGIKAGKFLYKAAEKNVDTITKLVNRAAERAIRKAGL